MSAPRMIPGAVAVETYDNAGWLEKSGFKVDVKHAICFKDKRTKSAIHGPYDLETYKGLNWSDWFSKDVFDEVLVHTVDVNVWSVSNATYVCTRAGIAWDCWLKERRYYMYQSTCSN